MDVVFDVGGDSKKMKARLFLVVNDLSVYLWYLANI